MEWWFIKNIKIESNRIVEDGEECYNLLKEGRENTLPVKNRKCIIKSGCMGECLRAASPMDSMGRKTGVSHVF